MVEIPAHITDALRYSTCPDCNVNGALMIYEERSLCRHCAHILNPQEFIVALREGVQRKEEGYVATNPIQPVQYPDNDPICPTCNAPSYSYEQDKCLDCGWSEHDEGDGGNPCPLCGKMTKYSDCPEDAPDFCCAECHGKQTALDPSWSRKSEDKAFQQGWLLIAGVLEDG